jgi:hypothetical protein
MVTFGKHKGKTIEQLCYVDPSYALWAYGKGLIVLTPSEQREVKEAKYYRDMERIAFELRHENYGDR